jgi:hypothetical protein
MESSGRSASASVSGSRGFNELMTASVLHPHIACHIFSCIDIDTSIDKEFRRIGKTKIYQYNCLL